MKINLNELDRLFTVNIIIGLGMLFLGAFYDVIADRLLIHHNSSQFPLLQVLWCVFWAGYVMLNVHYQKFYGE